MLHKNIERLFRRSTRLDQAIGNRHARSRAFNHFDALRRHQGDARRPARRMARTPGALQQAGDAFGRADLQHALDRQKIDSQIKA